MKIATCHNAKPSQRFFFFALCSAKNTKTFYIIIIIFRKINKYIYLSNFLPVLLYAFVTLCLLHCNNFTL